MGDIVVLILFFIVSVLAWVLKDVMKKWAPLTLLGLLLTCFVMNSTVLLPSSSLLVILEYSFVISPVSVVLVGAVGTSLGELTGYMMGVEGCALIKRFKRVSTATNFRKHDFWWVMIFALIPFPFFDFAGIMAGGVRMNPFRFLIACFLGKLIKMGFYVWVIHFMSSAFR